MCILIIHSDTFTWDKLWVHLHFHETDWASNLNLHEIDCDHIYIFVRQTEPVVSIYMRLTVITFTFSWDWASSLNLQKIDCDHIYIFVRQTELVVSTYMR